MSGYERLTETHEGLTLYELWQCYRRLAELEDKIENGTLVELPCKQGGFVEVKGKYIYCYQGHLQFQCLSHKQGYPIDAIVLGLLIKGECARVLDKSQAEKRLAELRGEK